MKRTTRASQANPTSYSTQQSQNEENEEESDCDEGSNEENDPDKDSSSEDETEQSNSVESTNNEENSKENAQNNVWIDEESDDFPSNPPNIPRFNGPTFESQSEKSKRLFNIPHPEKLTPLEWFFEILPESFWTEIVKFTNDQAVDDSEWKVLTLSEFWIFLALLFLNTIKSYPTYRYLWSQNWIYHCPRIHQLGMSRRRFEVIRKHLKFNDGTPIENDKYWRVRSILNELRKNCKRIVKPPQKISLDEMSPKFTGACGETISMPGKKSKKHFNARALTFPNGALYTFYLRHELLDDNDDDDDEEYQKLTPTSKSVVYLIKQLPPRSNWHHVFMDNLYSNEDLFKYLYSQYKIVCSGTWRKSKGKKIPDNLQLEKSKSKTFLDSHKTFRKIAAQDLTNEEETLILTGCSFYGTKGKHVHYLTTSRYKWEFITGGSKNANTLDAVHDYNINMHGNDLLDAIVEFYSVYFRSKRWTIRLACWCIDVCVATGYIHARYLGMERNHECLHAYWIEQLINALIEKSGVLNNINTDSNLHSLVHVGHQNNRKNCVVCYKNNKKQSKTYYKCDKCNVGLCSKGDCFKRYHASQ